MVAIDSDVLGLPMVLNWKAPRPCIIPRLWAPLCCSGQPNPWAEADREARILVAVRRQYRECWYRIWKFACVSSGYMRSGGERTQQLRTNPVSS